MLPNSLRRLTGWFCFIAIVAVVLLAVFGYLLRSLVDQTAISRFSAFAAFASAVAAFVAAVTTFLIVMLTARNVEATADLVTETRDARLAQSRPVILISFEVDSHNGRLNLLIGHYGGGPARNVQFRFAPKLLNEENKDIGAEPPFSTGIPLITPGYRQTAPFGTFAGYRSRWFFGPRPDGTRDTPGQWAATITFNDPLANDQKYTDTFVLGVEHLFEYNLTFYEDLTAEKIAAMPNRPRQYYERLLRQQENNSGPA